MTKNTLVLAAGVIVALLTTAGLISACAAPQTKTGAAPAASTTATTLYVAPVTDPPTTMSRTAVVVSWYGGSGKGDLDQLESDLAAVQTSAGNSDFAQLGVACSSLQTDAVTAQGDPAIPDPAADALWQKALTDFVSAGAACQVGASSFNADQITSASQSISDGGVQLSQLSDMITVGG